ncbi:MAG TPA: NAD(P)H-hydrate epimerase, partial [Kofleriaceae bacterium]|nr:NAD(P)H-hydrate epimerase [Kofleriaceae bacterium]
MLPVVTADEMRALDKATIEDIGLPAIVLMETAGRAVAEAALRMLGEARGHVAVVCGPGNNGGDGFVAARVLRDRGVDAVVYLAAGREAVKGDARAHLEIFERAGGTVRAVATADGLAANEAEIVDAALVIDALFGVGLARDVEGQFAEIVTRMLLAGRTLAVDIPSGLDTDTGRTLGTAVIAERTVTMAARKIALVGAPGFAKAGEIEVAEIGIPTALIVAAGVKAGLVEAADVAGWLPHPQAMDHKGRRGHVLVVGGSPGMRGAGRLAAMAALRAGAGLCTLAAEGELDAPDSVMTRSLAAGAALGELLGGKAAVVIGPGLGTSPAAAARVREVLAAKLPAVLDADALNLLAKDPAELARAAGPIVLTPHPGEAARLLGITTAEIETDRMAAARALAVKTRAVVVLKGARTIVCDGRSDGRSDVSTQSTPAVHSAADGAAEPRGSSDVDGSAEPQGDHKHGSAEPRGSSTAGSAAEPRGSSAVDGAAELRGS